MKAQQYSILIIALVLIHGTKRISSTLIFLSFRSLLIISFHVFLDCPLRKLPLTLKVLHLLDQELFPIISRSPKYCCLLFYKHSPLLFKFSLVPSSSVESSSSSLPLHIHLTILASLPDYIFLSNWPSLTSIYHIHMRNLTSTGSQKH